MSASTVLVVDDHKPNRDMLSRRLTNSGYQVLTAENGRETLRVLAEHEESIAVILLDLMMPDMSGLEVLDIIRAKHSSQALPVLMVSAITESPQMVSAIEHGANDYLTKPVDFQLLLAKLKHVLGSAPTPPARAQKSPENLRPGDRLAHYQLGKLLGEGGMGRVFQATDSKLLREVAIKVMRESALGTEVYRRFLLEAQAVARVSHPGVVTIYEIGDSPPYIAMELLEGTPLETRMQVSVAQAVDWTCQILDALDAVHARGIVHRDLKPSNVMIDQAGKIKVMDFGLAKVNDLNLKLTQSGEVWGTPAYMSPEHINPSLGPLDAQSDVFSVGLILYELLAGRQAFQGSNAGQLIYEVLHGQPPPLQVGVELGAIVMKALQKGKADRYESARAFQRALEALP